MDYLIVYSPYPYKKNRIGKENDGGYVICENIFNYDLLLSGGISNDISFEDYFTRKYNVKCIAFDGTINKIPSNNNDNITWIKKNIGPVNTDNTTNLKDIINSKKNIFLKMDIESYEFNWIKTITTDELKNISQIVIEFHFPFTDTSLTNISILDKSIEKSSEKIDCLKKLADTHYLVHFHCNNCCGTVNVENIIAPNVFECTYLRKDFFKNKPFKNVKSIPDKLLDYPNIINSRDIALTNYPFIDKKTIIFAMTHNTKNYKVDLSNIGTHMWGLGDILRGAIGLYNYSQKNNYYFYFDSQNHILNNFLDIIQNPYKDYVKEHSDNINFVLDADIDKYVSNFNENQPLIIYTNMFFNEIDTNIKKFIIDYFLKPKPILQSNIEKLLTTFTYSDNYEIIHCRLNDSEFNSCSNQDKYSNIYNKITPFIKENTIILSNSEHFKKYLKNKNPNIFQFNIKPAHLGYIESSFENSLDTLSEFFIMSKSMKIYTYSEYPWISGFVKSINDIYDVPIFDIKSL